jgi:hypothetical protein
MFKKNGATTSDFEKWLRYCETRRNECYQFYLEIIDLARAMPEKEFLLRPHPSENLDLLIEHFAMPENIVISNTQPISDQFLCSSMLLHINCTTAVEALKFKLLAVNLDYLVSKSEFESAYGSIISIQIPSRSALDRLIQKDERQNALLLEKQTDIAREKLPEFFNDDPVEKICSGLASVINDERLSLRDQVVQIMWIVWLILKKIGSISFGRSRLLSIGSKSVSVKAVLDREDRVRIFNICGIYLIMRRGVRR